MQAINLHFCDGYGNMTWDLSSEAAHSYFKSWNKQVRLCWNVDRKTHTDLVEDFLCDDIICLRIQVFSRYPQFVRYLSNIIDDDCLSLSKWKLKDLFPKRVVPTNECYKKSLLSFLLQTRIDKNYHSIRMSKQQAEEMIYSLCCT